MPEDGYDVEALRAHFPSLAGGTAYFDGPGGTQTPDVVGEAMRRAITQPLSNRGRLTPAERNADDTVLAARTALADLVGGAPEGVVFGRSMTQLTFDISRAMAKTWEPGDEIVVTKLDHDANVRPWVIAAENSGATVRWAEFDPATGELDPSAVTSLLTEDTRLVAVTAASNLIGTRPDLPTIAAAVREAGALLYVDGVHHTAHVATDVAELGADFYACSPYKFLGPHCGAVIAVPELLAELHPDKLVPATEQVPERFELGTLPYELMAGTTAAVDFLASLGDGRRPSQPAAVGVRRHREVRGRPAGAPRGGPGEPPVRRALAGEAAHAHGAGHLPRRGRGRGVGRAGRPRHQRAGQQLLRVGGLPPPRVSGTRAGCGSASRRTRPRTTSTACWPRWASC